MSNERRRCGRCRSSLASDNHGIYCASCDAAVDLLRQHPPAVPADFWSHPTIRDAARRRHMGHLIAAYRRHPHHGIPISQEIVGSWVGVTQGQISRMENGQPEQNLDRLVHWARLLAIPADLLWFTHPTLHGSIVAEPDPPDPASGLYAAESSNRAGRAGSDDEEEPLHRRTVLYGIVGALSVARNTLPADDRMEAVRRNVDRGLRAPVVTVQLVPGSQVRPLWRLVRASRALMPCLRAVER
ncbi:hypothetical protein GCM10022255_114800 [Dactylosporangium darangshiense]|uniref:HTH cro/C1-type domain-containing protein n=1 Tax=Dactylosporangium darangshiense TaxID=579108 RepID=A0ABP8DWA3_9ACTN